MSELTHFNQAGEAHMVDVGDKPESQRLARAIGRIRMLPDTLELIGRGESKKGDVLAVARIAGIMGAKRTADLVPLCHTLLLSKVSVDFQIDKETNSVICEAEVRTTGQTGVEMEALTAVQISLLTIYDMCKAVDKSMTMDGIGLLEKKGGRSGHWQREISPQDD